MCDKNYSSKSVDRKDLEYIASLTPIGDRWSVLDTWHISLYLCIETMPINCYIIKSCHRNQVMYQLVVSCYVS